MLTDGLWRVAGAVAGATEWLAAILWSMILVARAPAGRRR